MFDEKDKKLLVTLATKLTGGNQDGASRQESLIGNIERRMSDLGYSTLLDYLNFAESDADEFGQLISALTIHTTSWFRENPHFVAFQEILLEAVKKNEVFTVWCSACSTGEEVYSFAIMLEAFRSANPKFEYRVLGTDIDPVSIQIAERAIYANRTSNFHLDRYQAHLLTGTGETEGYFTLTKEIRSRCTFRVADLRLALNPGDGPFNVCVCRNVLIYFTPSGVDQIVRTIIPHIKPNGHLFLGHSETINSADHGVVQCGHSVFVKAESRAPSAFELKPGAMVKTPIATAVPQTKGATTAGADGKKLKVLSIDDSATARKQLNQHFTDMGFESTTVASAFEASKFLRLNRVDLITLDLKMPEMNGDQWLEGERKGGLTTPVVIVSDVHAADARSVVELLGRGAQEYLEKDRLFNKRSRLKDTFLEMIRGNSVKPKRERSRTTVPAGRPELILIGASTGGPQALMRILKGMPANSPPIVVTQHISQKFAGPLAERLAAISGLKLGSVENGAPISEGHIYVASNDQHIGVVEKDGALVVQTSSVPPINGHRPSVDAMFNSIKNNDFPTMALLLTGMGRDGAAGLRGLRNRGAFCVAQSEEDCVVYGMPREAIALDAADFVGNLDEIRRMLTESLNLKIKKSA